MFDTISIIVKLNISNMLKVPQSTNQPDRQTDWFQAPNIHLNIPRVGPGRRLP